MAKLRMTFTRSFCGRGWCGVFRVPLLWFIYLYQKTISPDHGWLRWCFPHGYCRFVPSCSVYGYEMIKRYGVVVGIVYTCWRILRCNPWSKGGEDHPPHLNITWFDGRGPRRRL